MSSTLDGMCDDVTFSVDNTMIRFKLQDSLGNYTLCDYNFQSKDDIIPLKKGDMVFCQGDFFPKIIAGDWVNIFNCNSLTARYEFDLLVFLIQYMPYMKVDNKNDIDTVTKYYRDVTTRICEYCNEMVGVPNTDNICRLFNGLYQSINLEDEHELLKFARYCFNNDNLKKIKNFFRIWNNNALIRPLELLGLSVDEIKTIHIPLHKAYEIIKGNPYRLPQVPIEKANKIVANHLRLNQEIVGDKTNHEILASTSIEATICGVITRMVYDNIEKKQWTSTPIARIVEKYPMYTEYKDILQKYYYCVEEYDQVYFKNMHNIEKAVANKMSYLIKKTDRQILDPIYPGVIPDKYQQAAIEGALKNGTSVVHGPPGTGKTKSSSEIIRSAHNMSDDKRKKQTLCLAMTGAATTRIRQATMDDGVNDITDIYTIKMAITIASKIIDIRYKYIIVDEISMVSSLLMAELFDAFRELDYRLILIGDFDQLEPIEPGNFLGQCLKTPIKRYFLEINHRSEKTIVQICRDIVNSKRILAHQNVDWSIVGDDYRFTPGDINVLDQWIKWYAESFQRDETLSVEENLKLFSKYRDKFTIVCPYKKDCAKINPIFQKYFMSYIKEYTELNGTRFYLGDRVMKLLNDYGINVMNGEIGKVVKVTPNYIVCIFRDKTETLTPYIEKQKFQVMKNFIKKNGVKFDPYHHDKDGKEREKTKDEINVEIEALKKQYLHCSNPSEILSEDDKKTIELYFSLLEEFPRALYKVADEAEFISVESICLAYALTTHKSQGSQYDIVIFFLTGKLSTFITVNNVYTACSRAKNLLHIMTETIELLNSACLNKKRFVYDKLYERINSKLPLEMMKKFTAEPEIDYSSNDTGIDDDYELDDDYDIGY